MASGVYGLELSGTILPEASMMAAMEGRDTLTVSGIAFVKARHCPDEY